LEDLKGMSVPQAREYITAHITQVKINEKQSADLKAEADKWRSRVELAHKQNEAELEIKAAEQASVVEAKIGALTAETAQLKADIQRMLQELPSLAARERSIDPDLLLQELLISAGMNPGDEAKLGVERSFADLEKDAAAGAELAALKAKLANEDKS
jgi:phage shock protein A